MSDIVRALAEARRIIDRVDTGDASLVDLASRVTGHLAGGRAAEMERRIYDALSLLLNTGIVQSEITQNQAACRAILDRIERASVPN